MFPTPHSTLTHHRPTRVAVENPEVLFGRMHTFPVESAPHPVRGSESSDEGRQKAQSRFMQPAEHSPEHTQMLEASTARKQPLERAVHCCIGQSDAPVYPTNITNVACPLTDNTAPAPMHCRRTDVSIGLCFEVSSSISSIAPQEPHRTYGDRALRCDSH